MVLCVKTKDQVIFTLIECVIVLSWMNIIIPFFEKHSLKTMKKVDFQKFRKVLLMMERNEHLTLTGLDAIRKIRRQKSLISQDRVQPYNRNIDGLI